MRAADQPFPKLLSTDLCKAIPHSGARAFVREDGDARQRERAAPSQLCRAGFGIKALTVQPPGCLQGHRHPQEPQILPAHSHAPARAGAMPLPAPRSRCWG